ncbi:MAG: UDP-N-acetylmuramoyl-L-alanine--D-glutamate ligase [Nitrospiraceae bacterium]|nr:MAG: UDP-N-acetylmuramoyl-L-alanine--D-glutamate ligase [Nitrospiraceae bacterium]
MSVMMSEQTSLEVTGKRVAVIGLGRSGLAAVRLLQRLGARVTVADQKPSSDLTAALGGLSAGEVEIHGAGGYTAALQGAEVVVVSPGVPLALEPLQRARQAGARIIGELELASRHLTHRMLAVTGTNGKSTTVTWIGELLRGAGYDPFVGGNLGTPLAEAALASLEGRAWDIVVAEVSSFQLETIESFRPWIGAILNITPDHLDRYPSMEAYAAAKLRLFANQGDEDYAVLNADDPWLSRSSVRSRSARIEFSRTRPVGRGVCLEGDVIVSNLYGRRDEVCRVGALQVRGTHNIENAMAAAAVAALAGCPMDVISQGLRAFRGLEHVMEIVRVLRGVAYINDSKGTNVDATIKALESVPAPVILIAGGREKGGEYPGLAEAVRRKARRVILLGEARARLREVLAGTCPITEAASLRDAVRDAAKTAAAGETVLLSPACASFDMFADYKDRGRQFKESVHELG